MLIIAMGIGFAAGCADPPFSYEKINGKIRADGMGPSAGSCSGCHMDVTRDFTWLFVP